RDDLVTGVQTCALPICYGTDFNNLTNMAVETALTNNHIVRISGLQPETKYFYAFGSSGQQLAGGTNVGGSNYWFVTSPMPGGAKIGRASCRERVRSEAV